MVSGCSGGTDFTAKNRTFKEKNLMQNPIVLIVGEQAAEFEKRYSNLLRIKREPAGLDFYKIDWDEKHPGIATVSKGKYSFEIQDVIGLSGTYNHDNEAEGITEFNLYAGITSANLIAHDEARLKTYRLLKKIEDAGWKIVTSRSRPRLVGKERFSYLLNNSSAIGLDLSYIPTLAEWMKIEDGTDWMFYTDHVYLTVNFSRERTLTDTAKPGAYLLNFNLKSEFEQFRGYVPSDDRQNWKALLPAALPKLAAMRTQKEEELRIKGFKINESYQDPPVPNPR